jgi:tryptophan synthase
MSKALAAAFSSAAERGRSAFVGFVTAGFPAKKETVSIMLAMERGGTDVIELGVPFTDPLADGATIQRTNEIALAGDNPVSLSDCLGLSKEARNQGLTKPVILMGYYNPFLAFGLEALMKECVASGVCGFIVVDLPPEEGANFVALCAAYGLSYVPLLTPTSTDDRIAKLAATATSFLYCVSLTGVTGARTELPPGLNTFIQRVRAQTSLPLAVGFGISTPAQVAQVSALADGVVVGSAFVTAIDSAGGAPPGPAVEAFVKGMVTKSAKPTSTSTATNAAPPAAAAGSMRSAPGSDGNWRKKVSSEPGARWSVEHAGLQRTRCIRARREGCAHAPCVLDVREISGASEQLRRVWRALCAGDSGGGAP